MYGGTWVGRHNGSGIYERRSHGALLKFAEALKTFEHFGSLRRVGAAICEAVHNFQDFIKNARPPIWTARAALAEPLLVYT